MRSIMPDTLAAPVTVVATGSTDDLDHPKPGIALCLSGGGYRAMLFHLGALWRLAELGYLAKLADYGLPDALPCPFAKTMVLAETKTRLKRLDADVQERLINWGYAVCDAAMRRHVEPGTTARPAFPYPNRGV
jgi:hypothetical protein